MQTDVSEYCDQMVSSPRGSFYIRVVLRVPQLLQVVKRRKVKHCLSHKRYGTLEVDLRGSSSRSFWDEWDHRVLWLFGIWSELGTQQELLL
ncbi:hypothetical protein D1007_34748 [Hordeum vulgare]|nr:hypothetical protein D1007_34748 [Hordeum vulgare]